MADVYHYVPAQFGFDYLLAGVSLLSRRTYWGRLARIELGEELYAVLFKLTLSVARRWVSTPFEGDVQEAFEERQTHTTLLAVWASKTVATASPTNGPSSKHSRSSFGRGVLWPMVPEVRSAASQVKLET